ncbi:MAG: radical SAM family heme chaperone HemW [Balneolaceae bacterium]
MSGIYIHIPFCRQACSYCDFYFVTRKGHREEFVERLCDEIEFYRETPYRDQPVETIYFGGGTPSLLRVDEVEKIMERLREVFQLRLQEVTMEMNPDDVDLNYLDGLREAGVDRASMGVQSFNPSLLRFMHRAHDSEQADRALEALCESRFPTYTADLIYGNPGQSLTDLDRDIDRLLRFDPPHISAYSLTIEPGTRLGRQEELGRLRPADDEAVAAHFNLLGERLSAAGIERYEISNYSRPGFEALHNTRYWSHHNYLGLGPSAHSFQWDGQTAERWKVEPDLGRYLSEPFEDLRNEKEQLTPEHLAEERIMLSLRTRWGVRREELMERYNYSFSERQQTWLAEKEQEGLLLQDEAVSLTEQGMLLADHLLVELLARH